MSQPTVRRMGRRLPAVPPGIMLTSMVDMMMVLLVFLIISFTPSEITPPPSKQLQLPLSLAEQTPEMAIKVIVNKDAILLEDKEIAPLTNHKIHPALKDNMLIVPLYDALQRHVEVKAQMLKDHPELMQKYRDKILIIADEKTPASLLDEVFYTVSQRDFAKFVLIVTKKQQQKPS